MGAYPNKWDYKKQVKKNIVILDRIQIEPNTAYNMARNGTMKLLIETVAKQNQWIEDSSSEK